MNNIMLPQLTRTLTSRESEYHNQSFNKYETKISKFDIIKTPIINLIKTLKKLFNQSKIVLVLYNETTQIINTIDEFNNIIPSGKTNFDQMFNELKNIKKEENMDQYLLILTDGQHNSGCTIEQLLENTNLIQFNMCLGIGDEFNIDSEFLKKLSGFKEDAYYVCSDQEEINDILFGSCLEHLNTDIKNCNIELVFENTNIIVTGEKSVEYLNEDELNLYLNSFNNAISNEITCCDLLHNNYLLQLKNKKQLNNTLQYIICIDISHSMNDIIYKLPTFSKTNSIIIDNSKKYVKINLKESSNFTNNSNILFNGKLISAAVKYNINNVTKYELVKIELNTVITYTDKINQYLNILNEFNKINKIPDIQKNFNIIKNSIIKLYTDNLTFINNIDKLDDWFVNQSNVLWGQITNIYKNFLTKGEFFINFRCLTPSALCRTITTNINNANILTKFKLEDTQLCKLCFSNFDYNDNILQNKM